MVKKETNKYRLEMPVGTYKIIIPLNNILGDRICENLGYYYF